jgi:hypothetical protein
VASIQGRLSAVLIVYCMDAWKVFIGVRSS